MTTPAALDAPAPLDPLGQAAVEPVERGMLVGLGTGRAAVRGVRALAARAACEGLRITAVATSRSTEALARELGLRVLAMEDTARVDLLFDGADEADGSLRLIKGRGGAMTRERIVARAAARTIYLVQREKMSARLGALAPLPIEVMPFARASVIARLRESGLVPVVRTNADGTGFVTDNANLVLDAPIPAGADPDALARTLDAMAGVIDHGLFLTEADELLIEEGERGPVARLERTPRRR
ncbi:MAG TPA: ribose-5-phosphate isomerase RpiA [Phycisphaerales bacterium]|nr:ribose-5-phosphate isomerase RpiA [Phycisphaerales bacterium]